MTDAGATAAASILLVEDSNTQALQMRILLEREGFAFRRAASAEAALEMMAAAQPDLLLVDYHLPGMNGDELVRQVRLNASTRALPILMLTGGPTRERELQGLDSGASAYVTKSADKALLIGQLRALLRGRGAAAKGPAPAGFQRSALMLVAADPACRRLFEPLLEAEGYRTSVVADAASALREMAARPADCVIVDVAAGGEEALRPLADIVAARTGDRSFEVIALGDDALGGGLKLRGFAAGADEVLLKGDDRDTQAARIRAVVRRKLARDEERRAADEERERQTALAAGAIIGTWNWDLITDRFKVDDAFARSFGLDPSLGRDGIPLAKIVATVHPDDQAGLTAAIGEAVKRGGAYAYQYRTRRADGAYYWLEANGRVNHGPDGAPVSFSGVLIDMEEHRALIEERDRAHNELRIVANTIPFLVAFLDEGLVFRFINAAHRQWFDRPLDELLGRTLAELAEPDRFAAQRAAVERALAGETAQLDVDWPWPDGRRRVAEVRYVPRRDGGEAVSGLCLFAQDVTAVRDAADFLNARNAALEGEAIDRMAELRLYRDIVLSDASAIVAFGKDHRLIGFNQAHAADMLRLMNHRQLVGEALPDLFPPEQALALRGYMDRALAGEHFVVTQEFGRPGQEMPCWEISYTPLRNGVGEIIGAFHHARDVSGRMRIERERDALEEQLRQSQKMEAVGQLTGGLAHDFNNLLAGISGSLELMAMRISQGRIKDIDKYMVAAQGAARRAAALTHRLLAFSRRQTLAPKPTNVNALVNGMIDLIQRTVGPAIHVNVVTVASLWPALVDAPQLENALLNLCINARDAMPGGGQITIETGNRWIDRHGARQHDMPEGQYLSLCVSDNGTGMPPEVIAKAFDPFFTTKPLGEGTGLGLSMIYGFAKQSGGQVRIYSEVGQGTMVCIYLPRHRGEAEAEAQGPERGPAPVAEAGETVLIVDDEPTVRMLVVDVLDDLGYTAIEAVDGAGGLKVLNSTARIDLLVTDVGLPGGMNGRQVADAGRVVRPDLKVLFITGFAENALLNNGQLGPGMAVITKPFAVDTLAARIRELITS